MTTFCRLTSCGARLSEEQEARKGQFCSHAHAVAWRRQTGYYEALAKNGLKAQAAYIQKHGHAPGAANRAKALERVRKNQSLQRKATIVSRQEPNWKQQTQAFYAFITRCQSLKIEELEALIKEIKHVNYRRMAQIILEDKNKEGRRDDENKVSKPDRRK